MSADKSADIKTKTFSEALYNVSNTQIAQNLLEIALSPTVFDIMTVLISVKIQDGGRNSGNSTFFRDILRSLVHSVQYFHKIPLSLTVFKINFIFNFHQNSR